MSDGKTEWLDLKTAKEASPIKAAKYAVANKNSDEPAFRRWVPYTLRKHESIINAVKRRSTKRRKMEKFGLEVPRPIDVRRALRIDEESGSTHWSSAIAKEVKTVIPVLKILDVKDKIPPGFKHIDLMIVLDVKMDLTRKARICARGDQIDTPPSVTYASVVTRESIRIF